MTTDSALEPLVALRYEDDGAIAVITLSNPAQGNAMSAAMGDAFRVTIQTLAAENGLRAVLICGEGKDFSIGGHRDMLQSLADGSRTSDELRRHMLAFYDRWLSVLDLEVPIISVLRGACIGVAPVFACISDLTIAEESAFIEITFASLGLYPGMGLPYLLPRTVGAQAASWLLLSGERISGAEAARIGLVTKSVPHGEGFEAALALARRISGNAPGTVALLLKKLRVNRKELDPTLEQNADQQAKDFQTEEYRQRISTYLSDYYA